MANSTIELPFEWEDRLKEEQLGLRKYSTNARALGELITNAFDAKASRVEITVKDNGIGGAESVSIQDDGDGMSLELIQGRFRRVGVEPDIKHGQPRFGRFGVGRFAVFRVGRASSWTTIHKSANGKFTRCTFALVGGADGKTLKVSVESELENLKAGTRIEIRGVEDLRPDAAALGQLGDDLAAQFCGYILGNAGKQILVQDKPVDVRDLIESQEEEVLAVAGRPYGEALIRHLVLKKAVDLTRFPRQLLFASGGRTIVDLDLDEPPSANYLGIVDSKYLDKIVSANREALAELDSGFHILKADSLEAIQRFGEKLQANQERGFIERARQQDFYPFRAPTADPVLQAEQALYDVVLEKLDERAKLESMTKKQQAIVFQLLHKAMANQNLLEILEQVAQLSEKDIEQFRKVLEYTTLDSIIRLSSEVTSRLHFLDVLQELTYGDFSKHLKERSQLHKILESQCWLFGAKFHLAASDKSFRTVIERHRAAAELPALDEVDLSALKNVDDIPDLFLTASRHFNIAPKHHHVLVELKRPSVSLSDKERQQAKKYALKVLESAEFDKAQTEFDVFLVSSKVHSDLEPERNQEGKPVGLLLHWPRMRVWAFTWGELISRARDEMSLVREHLKQRSIELSVSDYLKQSFPNILENLASKVGAVGAKTPVGEMPQSPAAGQPQAAKTKKA